MAELVDQGGTRPTFGYLLKFTLNNSLMIVAVGTSTFFKMLYSLSLVAIRPTLLIYCD